MGSYGLSSGVHVGFANDGGGHASVYIHISLCVCVCVSNLILNLVQKLGLIKRTNGQLCFWALRSTHHFQSLYFLLSVTFPINLYFPSRFHFSLYSLYRSLSLFLFLCSFPPISVGLKLCHSSYITQQSSRARLVTTKNQLLPGQPHPPS